MRPLKRTLSICPNSSEDVFANVLVDATGVWMKKDCPCCKESLMEIDPLFYLASERGYSMYGKRGMDQRQIQIDISKDCNKRCNFCYFMDNEFEVEEPSVADIVKLAVQGGFGRVMLSGGEPTLRDDLPEILESLCSNGVIPTVYTNGIRLRDEPDFYKRIKPFLLRKNGSINLVLSVQGEPAYFTDERIRQVSFIVGPGVDVMECIKNNHGRAEGLVFQYPLFTRRFMSECVRSLKDFEIDYSTFSPYHTRIFSKDYGYVIFKCWPSVENVDLQLLRSFGDVCAYKTPTSKGYMNSVEAILRSYLSARTTSQPGLPSPGQ